MAREQEAATVSTTNRSFTRAAFHKSLRLFRFVKPYRWMFLIGMLLLAVSSLVFMVFPIASGEIINIATGKGQYGLTLNDIGAGLLIILLIQSVVSFSRVLLFTHLSERTMADIRNALYARLITLPIGFFEQNRVGDLTSRASSDVQHLQDTLSVTIAEFTRQIIVLTAGIAFLIYKTPQLSLLMLATFPVLVFFAVIIGRYIRTLSRKRQDALAASNVILEETFQSIQVVKTFTNEWFEAARYKKANQDIVKLAINLGINRALFIAFIIGILFGVVFYVLWRGAVMVSEGIMLPGDLVAFIAITAIIGATMGGLADLYTQLVRAIGASERIMDMLDMKGEVALQQTSKSKEPVNGAVVFDNVHFSYPSRPDVPVLKGLSLQVSPGEKVAFVGKSGAGKSTIIQLLLRLHNPDTGIIKLEGTDIQSINISQYRSHFAIVPQDVILFGGTISENIRYGNLTASETQIREAAMRANALEFINQFPDGFDTVVGERGVRLSGGQRQRIAIARAILRDPVILILDEATSSLDAGSERIVQEALDNLLEGRTALIIAHRLATIRHVDRICVLEDGHIIEEGTHDQLLNNPDGHYRQLAALQFDITI